MDEKETQKEKESPTSSIHEIEYPSAKEMKENEEQEAALNEVEPIQYQKAEPTTERKIQTGAENAIKGSANIAGYFGEKALNIGVGTAKYVGEKTSEYIKKKRAKRQMEQAQQQPVQRFDHRTIELVKGGISAPSESPLIRQNQIQFFEQPSSRRMFNMMGTSGDSQMFGGGSNVIAKMGGLGGGGNVLAKMGGFSMRPNKPARPIRGRPNRPTGKPKLTALQQMMFGKKGKRKGRWFQ